MPIAPREVDLNEVERLASLGLTQVQVGAALGLSRSAVQDRLGTGHAGSVDTAFAARYATGRAALAQEVAGLLLDAARGGSVDAMKFLGNNLLLWSKNVKAEIEQTTYTPTFRLYMQSEQGPVGYEEYEEFKKFKESRLVEKE